jgi:RNA polymerase sigma-70 factor (ECF subfamily)
MAAASASDPMIPSEALLRAAQNGDAEAFEQLVEPRVDELRAYCYRMLGSLQDADDAVQEALLRAWRGLPRFEGRSSLRSWLFRITTNACLQLIARRPKRVLATDDRPAVEPLWVELCPDELLGLDDGRTSPDARYEQRESVELAFIAALQHLAPNQRAALVLREVLGFSAREVAELLETTAAAVNSALQRARAASDERLPAQSQQVTARALGDRRLREIVEAYMDAFERGDVDAVVSLLSEDATWSMPPYPDRYHGRDAIVRFLKQARSASAGATSGQRRTASPAVGCYLWDRQRERYVARVIDVLTLHGARIGEVTSFVQPDAFGRLGLPVELPR